MSTKQRENSQRINTTRKISSPLVIGELVLDDEVVIDSRDDGPGKVRGDRGGRVAVGLVEDHLLAIWRGACRGRCSYGQR